MSVRSGRNHWWTNWPATFGYVCNEIDYPTSRAELADAIQAATAAGQSIKAVGGGWSFSDASLPFATQAEVDAVSLQRQGTAQKKNLSAWFPGMKNAAGVPFDTTPQDITQEVLGLTTYDRSTLTQTVAACAAIPSRNVRLIDTRGMASSLQDQLPSLLCAGARLKTTAGTHYFHVEAGITMTDLDRLLDHQHPRLAIQASGGSPGATLAGTLSTATHGGEHRWPLLVDRVRAVHLVGANGQQWWIEGGEPIADPQSPLLAGVTFIGGAWNAVAGLTAQDVLDAVVVSMGTLGVFYSVVLEVLPQFGLQQKVVSSTWEALLAAAGTSAAALRQNDVAANDAVLKALIDGATNGTTIPAAENVYVDLALNPFSHTSRQCWITNRRLTPAVPLDADGASTVSSYVNEVTSALSAHAAGGVQGNATAGRLFDFLSLARDIPVNPLDDAHDATEAVHMVTFLANQPDLLASLLATISAQAVANTANHGDHADRGQLFLEDLLTGLLNALQGTIAVKGVRKLADATGVSYQVGAVGWPDGGVPGRGMEIALHPSKAFSFLQTVLLDDIFQNVMVKQSKPLLGYVSVRICPPTTRLMGMQQFAPYSAMIELVSYRSPEADALMDTIQQRVVTMNAQGLGAMLHWGLENDRLGAGDLARTPLNDPLRPGSAFTKLGAFKEVRKLLLGGRPSPFDNNFVRRLGL